MTEAVEQTQEATDQDDAAFEAGFAEARGDELPTEQAVPEAAQPEPEAAPEPEIVFGGLTEEQLKAALAKAGEVDEMKTQVRQLFGRMGEFNSRIQSLQQSGAAGQPTKISADQLKKLQASYPEFASDLAEDLSSLVIGGGSSSFDPEPMRAEMEQRLASEIDRITKANEIKLLRMRHRDYESVRATDDFKLWEQTLPTEERKELLDSWDAAYIGDQLDTFKAWRDSALTSKQQKQNRLAAAVTPRGAPSAVPNSINDDAAFEAGFRSVRRG